MGGLWIKWTAVYLGWSVHPTAILIKKTNPEKNVQFFLKQYMHIANGVHYYHANLQREITYI
jgi:hypothetical protein